MYPFNHDIKKPALAGLFFLFFLWGALTCLNTLIIPHLEKLFIFKYTSTFGFANAFFGSYLIMAIPSALLIKAVNYKRSIIIGLFITALGTILFIFASKYISYAVFITGFVILASGITLIQVAANTYVSILGHKQQAAVRLSLAQAINSLGYVLVLAVTFNPIFTGHDSIVYNARNIQQPYLIITILIVFASLLYTRLHFPGKPAIPQQKSRIWFNHSPGLYLAALAIFFYVGAELTVSRIIQSTFSESYSSGVITIMLLCYWGGMMAGRFAGFAFFQFRSPVAVLQINAILCIAILIATHFLPFGVMVWLLILLGFFNSIMFPALFATGLNQSVNPSCFDGAVLIMAISGGALIPALYNQLSIHVGLQISLLILAVCYLIIAAVGYFLLRYPVIRESSIAETLPQEEKP
ncbi:MAG: hypothetical protein JW973_07785 [Bacteroidales bacterium]|nr:hypothetical protein [Bacteroidales bacterium]